MCFIIDVEHQRRVHDVLVDAVFWDAHVGCGTHHVTYGAVTVCTVFHEQLSRMQEKMHLRANLSKWLFEFPECLLVFGLHD